MKGRILLVDDDPGIRFGFAKYLQKVGYAVDTAGTIEEGRHLLAERRSQVAILDMNLPDGNGLDWIPELRESHPEMPLIVITGLGDIPTAVEAMRRGADHFLTKPVDLAELDVFLQKGLELETLRRQQGVQRRLARRDEPFLGGAPAMNEALEAAKMAAASEAPVLLQGETGSGKGVLARWIHEQGPRPAAPFVEVNCSGLRGELLSSELFGHAKGAFTSAVADRQGLIEVADGGTLFLDEIGDMDSETQAQFLKVIEDKRFRRLGEVKVRTSEFRLLCATNRDNGREVEARRFRKDLLYRVNVLPIPLPPRRARREDLPGRVEHLLGALGAPPEPLPAAVMDLLGGYPWPGNVRELKNVLERALLLAQGGPLEPRHFPGLGPGGSTPSPSGLAGLKALERDHIREVVRQCGGDTLKAAGLLGISRATLYRKLKNQG
jgi:DNA-binding NtrC family response regulator